MSNVINDQLNLTDEQRNFISGNTSDNQHVLTEEQCAYIAKFNQLTLNQKQRLVMKHKALPPIEEIERTLNINTERKRLNTYWSNLHSKRYDKQYHVPAGDLR